MRRTIVVAVVAALVLVPALALAGPDDAKRAGAVRQELAAQSHAPFGVPSQDNLGRAIYNHFGSPFAGQALIETWIRTTYDDQGLPQTVQGFGSASRVHNVQRIAIRVVLHTRGGTNPSDVSGPTANNGNQEDNPKIFNVTSPTLAAGKNPGTDTTPWCEAWTTVHYAIRWTDGSLSAGKTLTAPSDLFNDNCYFLGGP